ncbi:hypothetical protein RchiOBHm_Chr1g0361671 [Rosa chinensis]|uniref:Uncharacterized protein n=1 Tax=Rosa chinensis TaxID=74649 RepID=A0A2P6SJ23_ROSCH|nr:hypothetical protein RchiOBHm_Chr1g0361671 [Rosa chinensis]
MESLTGKGGDPMRFVHELRFVAWRLQNMLMDVVFGCFMCLSTFLFAPRALFSTFPRSLGYYYVFVVFLKFSMCKILLLWMMTAVEHCSFSSLGETVITRTAMSRCIAAFFSAHVVKSLRTFRCFITFCLLYIRRCFFENKYFCYVLQRQGQ